MSLRLDATDRARLRDLKAAERAILAPAKQARKAEQNAARRAQPKREQRIEHKPMKADGGRDRDPAYLSWLHHDVPCIACLILGSSPREHSHPEAAHQKAQDAGRGWHKLMGRRVHDRQACTLCAWHHRIAPYCCDPAQARFWSLLGVDVVAFCTDLHGAFTAGQPGAAVVRRFAGQARSAA